MPWLKVKQAAQHMGLSSRTVRDLLNNGLPHSRLPSGTILLEDCQIDEYLRSFDIQRQDNQLVDNLVKELKL